MRQFAVVLLTLLCSNFLNAQDTINQKDDAGLKQGHWIYYGKDRPESGIPVDGKVEEGNYVNDRKEGEWIKYCDDGKTPKIKANYANNRPVGTYFKYEDSVWTEHSFSERVGTANLIRGRGALDGLYSATYNSNGKEEGCVKYFYPDGQLEFIYFAKNGTPVDTAYRYYENGDLKEMIVYGQEGEVVKTQEHEIKNPLPPKPNSGDKPEKLPANIDTHGETWKPDGYNKVYNEDGEVWMDGIFKNGELYDGKVYSYDRDGILFRVRIFKSGVYHSDGKL